MRTKTEQDELFAKGKTKLKYPESKHNRDPSLAIDIAPYFPQYGIIFGNPEQVETIMAQTGKSKEQVQLFIKKAYARLIGIVEGIALIRKIELRVDKTGIIHAACGKVSFDEKALYENIEAVINTIKKAKPSSVKGKYMKKVTISSTMGPGIKVDYSALR